MLDLTLREEFQAARLKGTEIQLRNRAKTGALQRTAQKFLEITYPSGDVLQSLRAISAEQARPVVLMGSRGRGKSHLMAALHHALSDREATVQWLQHWSGQLNQPGLEELNLPQGLTVISESLHEGNFGFLWDLLLARHPRGEYYRGRWSDQKTKSPFPSKTLLAEMFEEVPTALLFDEYQTYYDGLEEKDSRPHRTWAFNFIQLLSEIASEQPDRLRLVVTVRDGTSDAYQQIHRVNPLKIDFSGPQARQDRLRLLLHRLFQNRAMIEPASITALVQVHVDQYLKLYEVPADLVGSERKLYLEAWPFSPQLMTLLEDQVLVATDTQQTRDLLIILANLFKARGNKAPVITAADFDLLSQEDEASSQIEAVASENHRQLREVAGRNLLAVQTGVPQWKNETPHVEGILTALWLRSIAVGNAGGAEPRALQLDVTRDQPLDANKFAAELETIEANSFNIHPSGNRLIFRPDENPGARLLAEARNDNLFADGSDYRELAQQIRYCLSGSDDTSRNFVVVVLDRNWRAQPWANLVDSVKPESWGDRIPLLVLPERPKDLPANLGPWLKDHLGAGRNKPRLLFPRQEMSHLHNDKELLLKARAALKAGEWGKGQALYKGLDKKYSAELQSALKDRFDRFAILGTWNYQQPEQSTFRLEKISEQGGKIPDAIERSVREDLFEPEVFEELVLQIAQQNQTVAKLLADLREPRPNQQACIPWLGEAVIKDRLLRMCSNGKVSLNLREMETLQRKPGEDSPEAWNRMKGRLGTGKDLETTRIQLPQSQAASQVLLPALGGADLAHQPSSPGYTPQAPPASPFTPAATVAPPLKVESAPSTAPLNLLGRLESWGVGAANRVRKVQLEIEWESTNGAQLSELLRKLPDGVRCSLQLEREE